MREISLQSHVTVATKIPNIQRWSNDSFILDPVKPPMMELFA